MKQLTAALVVLVAAVVAAAFAPVAAADQPTTVQNNRTETDILTGACSFAITVDATITETDRFFVDHNGVLTAANADFTEQDTFSANGQSLTGLPYSGTIQAQFDNSGNITQEYIDGVTERVPLPDGTTFQSAGRVDIAADGFPSFVVVPTTGTARNLAGFCAALS